MKLKVQEAAGVRIDVSRTKSIVESQDIAYLKSGFSLP